MKKPVGFMLSISACTVAFTALWAASNAAGAADDFYAKNRMTVLIGTPVGGSYDLMGRLTARHISKHIPDKPSIIVQNMPGGGSLVAANYLYNVAAQDGSVLGCVVPGIILTALFKDSTARYDPSKMQWVGNAMDGSPVGVVFHTSQYKTLEDLKKHEILVGGTGVSGFDAMDPLIYNALAGTKLKVVRGYKGGQALDLAIERGEVQGRLGQAWAGWRAIHPDWVRDRKVIPFMQLTLDRIDDPSLKDVPRLIDVVSSADLALARSYTVIPNMGRPTVMGPGVPRDRVAIMRAAYAAMVKDPAFIEEAKKQGVALKSIDGQKLQSMVAEIHGLDKQQVGRLYNILEWDKRGRNKKK